MWPELSPPFRQLENLSSFRPNDRRIERPTDVASRSPKAAQVSGVYDRQGEAGLGVR